MSTRKLTLTYILRLSISCCRLRLKLSLTRNFNFTILFTSPRHLVKPYQESTLLILNLNYFLCEIGYNTSCASKVNAKRLCVYIIKIFTHVIKTFHCWFHPRSRMTNGADFRVKNCMILELRKVFIFNSLLVWKWINFLVAIEFVWGLVVELSICRFLCCRKRWFFWNIMNWQY